MYNYIKRVYFNLPLLALFIFIGFILLSIPFYPGSTYLEYTTVGYSFFNNFLSDLGRTITHGGSQNFISAFFFNNAMFISGILFLLFYIFLPEYFYSESFLNKIAKFASSLGVLGSISFCFVGLTPADLYLQNHIFFANNIFYLSFPCALLYSIIIIKSKNLSSIYGIGYFLFSIPLLLYIFILEFGPNIKTEFGLIVQATSQKIITLFFIMSTFMLSIGIKKNYN